jgi:hypothetical protein
MKGVVFARAKIVPVGCKLYITPNKLYINARWDGNGGQSTEDSTMYILNDVGYEIFILEKQCACIGGNDWEFLRPNELGELI